MTKMRNDEEFKEFYEAIWVNLFQISLNMSVLHEQNTLLMSGTVLNFVPDLSPLFARALSMIHSDEMPEKRFLRLQELEGMIGALGSLQEAMKDFKN